jgi:hypothetical protein
VAKKTGNEIDNQLAKVLAAQFWPLYDNDTSDYDRAEVGSLEARESAPDNLGEILFTPKTIYFNSDQEPVQMSEEKVESGDETPTYILEADYSEELDKLLVWSTDDRSSP